MTQEKATVPLDKLMASTPGLATKISILHAVNEPLVTMPVEKICQRCGISRQTFYHHFKSKYDIVFWFSDLCQTFYLDEIGRRYTWREGFFQHFSLLLAERDFLVFTVTGKPVQSNQQDIQRKHESRKQTIIETLTDYRFVTPDESLLFQVDAFVYIESEMTRRWFRDGMTKSAQAFARDMETVVPRSLYRLLDGAA